MDDRQLRTIWQQRQIQYQLDPLAAPLKMFMKRTLEPRVRSLGALAALWDELLPAEISKHTVLESFRRGVLTVMVDSASHRFHIQNLLAGGLMAELRSRFTGTLRQVKLVPGQFYAVDEGGDRRYEFSGDRSSARRRR